MPRTNFKDLILFEDHNFIVINKPPFISCLDDRKIPLNILGLARKYQGDSQLCHRLDKETSGCLIIAKNHHAYKHVSVQFQSRKVIKKYHALTEGIHNFKEKVINSPVAGKSGGYARIDFKHGKPAITKVNSIRAFRGYTLVEALPVTGRLHQIRVHLAAVNAPIAGDTSYGAHPFYLSSIKRNYNPGKWKEERPLIKRLALHAISIAFNDPDGKQIEVSAHYPKDFNALLHQLDRYAGV